MSNIFAKLKGVISLPKQAVEVVLRRKAISAVVAGIAGILLVYGVELPKDVQDSITAIIDFLIGAS